jgi:cytochrome d ubiquinol oxidase subunit I
MNFLTNDLLAARSTMAFSLAFHIIFASVGMVMPFFMAASHFLYLKTNHKTYLALTKMWSKGVAVLFATGAVTGTVLSFELGLLWPNFMKHAGPIIGMPFSWEGTAFFLEAIAIGIFFYGWDRIPVWIHWFSGLIVGLAGLISGIFIVSANAWMNTPSGFDWANGMATNINPILAMFNKHWFQQALHMSLAAFTAVGFAVAGIHAALLLKNKKRKLNAFALKIALTFGAIAAILQPLSGHHSAQMVAKNQPAKFAAMEAHFKTEAHAGLNIGGFPLEEKNKLIGAITIPGVLSFLAHNDFQTKVTGLDQFPRSDWAPVAIVHISFQIMVLCGFILALTGIFFLFKTYVQKNQVYSHWLLRSLVFLIPVGFIALEAGWTVTEVGRQPWIIYGILRTKDGLSVVPGMGLHFALFLLLYLIVGASCLYLMYRLIKSYQGEMDVD